MGVNFRNVTPLESVVCFDLGGVLLRIGHTWEAASLSTGLLVSKRAATAPLSELPEFVGFQAGELEEEHYALALGEWLELSPSDALKVHDAIIIEDYQGAKELVQDLNSAGVLTCCFSNTNARHWAVLTNPVRHPAIASLRLQFASHLVGRSKPEVGAFHAVAAELPEGKRIVFFDDASENVMGAAEAGWLAFKANPTPNPVPEIRRILAELGLFEHTETRV